LHPYNVSAWNGHVISKDASPMSEAMLKKPIVAIHKNDPQWIISLWLAIHGGDPAPDTISERQVGVTAVNAIRALAAYLPAAKAKAITAALGQ
jgi:hypothetical protein